MANQNATTERTSLQTKRCSMDEAAALRKNHVVRLYACQSAPQCMHCCANAVRKSLPHSGQGFVFFFPSIQEPGIKSRVSEVTQSTFMVMRVDNTLQPIRAPRFQSVKTVSPRKINPAIAITAASQRRRYNSPKPASNAAPAKKSFTGVFGLLGILTESRNTVIYDSLSDKLSSLTVVVDFLSKCQVFEAFRRLNFSADRRHHYRYLISNRNST